jgi:5'-nucleotidase
MKIWVDIDDVLADLSSEWIAEYNHDWYDNLKPSDIHSWSWDKYVKHECGHKIYNYIKSPKIYDHVLPISGAFDGIKAIRNKNHNIGFVTRFLPGSSWAKYGWLQDHGFLYPEDEYVETLNKGILIGDILIDDNFPNCYSFTNLKLGQVGCLFTQPHNKSFEYEPRVSGWFGERTVLDFIQECEIMLS